MDSSHQMFFTNFTIFQKGWQVPKASCPKGDSMCLTQTLTPAQEAFKLGLKTFCISFSIARISDALFAMLTVALVDQGTGCLCFACCFPQVPALLPGHASSCLPLNKKYCAQPTLGEGERFPTSTWASAGIQDEDQDLKCNKCICRGASAVLLVHCKLFESDIK